MKSFRQYNEELAEAVDNWVVTVAKPVNKLKKGAEQKVKARSAFEAINKKALDQSQCVKLVSTISKIYAYI